MDRADVKVANFGRPLLLLLEKAKKQIAIFQRYKSNVELQLLQVATSHCVSIWFVFLMLRCC